MRNPFRSKNKKNQNTPNKPIKEPWTPKPIDQSNYRATNETVVGRKADRPFIDKNQASAFGHNYRCVECSYPLRTLASVESPCPNCGYTGGQPEPPVKPNLESAKKTIKFNSIDFGQNEKVEDSSETKVFTLVNESSPDMSIMADLGEANTIILGRDELDPGNTSISSEGHIQLRENRGSWYIEDVSSNGATFMQALSYQPLREGTRIILGNRIFRFSAGSSLPNQNTGKRTMQFGQFDLANSSNSVTLVDEMEGSTKAFTGRDIDLNRITLGIDEPSISRQQHATLENRDGTWMIVDRSANKATFVQVMNEVLLRDQTRLILGSKVYRFELSSEE